MKKIAVASDDGKQIAGHLGRVRGFIIYEIDGQKISNSYYLQNNFTGHARGLQNAGHGTDRHGPILSALAGCDAVISHGMGRRIIADLEHAGIQAFVVTENEADRAVQLYLQDQLQHNPTLGCDH